MKTFTMLLTLLIGCSTVFAAETASPENAVLNPSFEDGTKNWGTLVNAGKFNFSIDSVIFKSGKCSAKMECTAINPKADGTWRQPKAWARWVQKVTVKPGAKYQFRCFARTNKNAPGKVTIYITGNEKPDVIGFTQQLDGDRWIEVKNSTFKAKGKTAVIYVNYYGENSMWIDDVELIEIR